MPHLLRARTVGLLALVVGLLAPVVALLASCAPGLPTPEGEAGPGPDRAPNGIAPEDAAPDGAPAGTFRIVFFDVGQGDAVLLEAPTGQRVLIDAGPDERIVELLRREGVEGLDLFVASHNHADHIGGAAAVFRAFPVRFFMDNGVPHTTATYRRMLEALRERNVPLLEPERREIRLGDAALEILPPPGEARLGHNDNSVGVILRFGHFRASFAGDAERRLWDHWLEAFPEALAPVQIHKASHHGSRNGDTEEAIARLQPELVVVSAGRENQFGHPHAEALALYEAVGATVLTTGEQGTRAVRAATDGTFRVEGEPGTETEASSDHPAGGRQETATAHPRLRQSAEHNPRN